MERKTLNFTASNLSYTDESDLQCSEFFKEYPSTMITVEIPEESKEEKTLRVRQEEERRLAREREAEEEKAMLQERKSHFVREDGSLNYFLHSLHINKSSYRKIGQSSRFYTEDFTFKPGINLLFGGNGQGKSSLISYISAFGQDPEKVWSEQEFVWDNCILKGNHGAAKIFNFSNSQHNQRYNSEPDSFFEFARHMQTKERSEGQSVMQAVSDFLYAMDDDSILPPDESAVLLIDEIDSGLDAIACKYLVRRIKKILKRKPNIQVFVAFNQYEMSKLDSQWINVCTGKIEDCARSYEEYLHRLSTNKKNYSRKVDREVRK